MEQGVPQILYRDLQMWVKEAVHRKAEKVHYQSKLFSKPDT